MRTSTSERGRVLIVDDDRKILDLLVDLLELEGYLVSTASDGAQAIELALSFQPDLIVSDVVMPVLGGGTAGTAGLRTATKASVLPPLSTWTALTMGKKPLLFETTLPGVFAVGDVRSNNVKRVASAVGEGAIAISLVHRVLQEQATASQA